MTERKLGIAMIGCGLIGGFHYRALHNIPTYLVKGAWDANPEQTTNFTKQFGLKAYTTCRELLDDPEVDLVDICLPSGLHAEYGCLAAQAGKHVIVEKPIDITYEAANHLIQTCNQNQVYLAVILQNRFSNAVLKVKQALEQQVLGRIIAGEASIKWFREEKYYQTSQWKGTKRLDGGGALINQSIHYIDLLLWFLGDVKSVTSLVRTARHQIEVEDLAMALVEFKSGAIGTITGSTAMKPGFPERIEIYGEKGSIALEVGKIIRWKVDGYEEAAYVDPVATHCASADPAGIAIELHQIQLTAIAEAIIAGKQPPVSGPEAIKALHLILDIYQANGQWLTRS